MASSETPAASLCDVLVVDAAGFLRNCPLQSLGSEVVTLREVVSEIKDKATKQRLQVLPYELKFKDADTECIKKGEREENEIRDFYIL